MNGMVKTRRRRGWDRDRAGGRGTGGRFKFPRGTRGMEMAKLGEVCRGQRQKGNGGG